MDSDEDILRPQKVFFLDTNLDSPVLTTEFAQTKNLLNDYHAWKTGRKNLFSFDHKKKAALVELGKVSKRNGWKASELMRLEMLPPKVYPQCETLMLRGNKGHSFYEESRAICQELEETLKEGLLARGLPLKEVEGVIEGFSNKKYDHYERAYEMFGDLFGRAASRVKNAEYRWTKGTIGELVIWVTSQYALVSVDQRLFYSTLNQVLMLKDKVSTRYMLLSHVDPLRLPSELHNQLLSLFRWQDKCLMHYDNAAYDVLKSVEPLYKTWMSHISDNVFGDDTAYTRMRSKLQLKEHKLRFEGYTVVGMVDELCSLVERTSNLEVVVEMFGSMKSSGHPVIDPERGGLSAADEALSPDPTLLHDAQLLRNHFCDIILRAYVSKHGVWPRLTFLQLGTKLETLSRRQERDLDRNKYSLTDWDHVEWNKFLDMDYYPNYLELMDDKSISYYRDEKHLTWDTTSKNPRSQRRLLLEILRRGDFSIEDTVKMVSTRRIPWEWLIVSLYPKEREFKRDARMFSMMVLEMRAFFACIEANIADRVFEYMPQQTMTQSKTQIQERFLSFTDPNRSGRDHPLFLEVDLSRWNLRWRKMAIHMIGHDLNRMFGVQGTFTVTHWFFEKCQIVVRVGGLRPEGIDQKEPPVSGLAWRDHLGGFEGINQKLWTAATYSMMEMALRPLMDAGVIIGYELVGQGDNQVIRLQILKTEEDRASHLKRVRDIVNRALETTCAKVNQIVKPEENIESTSVLTYSKDVYISGVEYPTTLKKHSRLFPVTSLDFPSICSNGSAIMAGAVAAAENSRKPLRSLLVGWYHTARYLLAATSGYSIHGRQCPRLSRAQVIAALLIPPSVGGYIGTPIASFMYKGGSDPLGKEVSSMRLMAESPRFSGALVSRTLRGLEGGYMMEPKPDLRVLIDNPYGLPLSKRSAPISQVSKLTLDAFVGKVKNKDIKPLLSRSSLSAEEVLKEDILSVRPLNPLLAHDLFECSGFGTIKKMRKMFLTTRTIQNVAQWVNPNITHTFLDSDKNEIRWFQGWVKGLPLQGYSGRDSYTLVSQFRRYWGVELHGVTNYQPMDYTHVPHQTKNKSSVKWSSHAATDLYTTRGPLSGYLGSVTREKRSEHGYKIADRGEATRSIEKLQLIRSQANGNLIFNRLLDQIGLTRSPCVLSTITDLLDHILGGSLGHRYAGTVRLLHAAFVGPLNFVTHIRLDTDNIEFISGSVLNFSVMLQEFMVYTMGCAKISNIHQGARCGELVLNFTDLVPLPDDSLNCSRNLFSHVKLPRSHLLYTQNIQLIRTYDSVAASIPRGAVVRSDTYSSLPVIMNAFRGTIFAVLRDHKLSRQLADTRGLVEVSSRRRIDIAEAHGLGPLRLAQGCAEAIVWTLVRDAFRTLHIHPERWDESLFLDTQIDACFSVVGQYFSHPLFNGHKDASRFRGSTLRYAKSMSTRARFKGHVRGVLSDIYNDAGHKFWSLRVPSFAGEEAITIAEAVTTGVACSLLRYYVMSHPLAGEFSKLFTNITNIRRNIEMTPEQYLDLLRARLTTLARIIHRSGELELSDIITRSSRLQTILVHNDDTQTILRNARGIEPSEGETRSMALQSHYTLPLLDTVCEHCLPAPIRRDQLMWETNSVRTRGGLSAAGYTWLPCVRSMRVASKVIVAGSGNGGLADMLIELLHVDVVGIDLERDLPTELATLMNYTPVGIQTHNQQCYTQSDASLTTTGDWYSADVSHLLLSSVPVVTSVLIDITTSTDETQLNYNYTLFKHWENLYSLYIRVVWEGGVDDLFIKSRALGFTEFWCLGRTPWSCLVIVGAVKAETRPHVCSETAVFGYKTLGKVSSLCIPARYAELLQSAINSVISVEGRTLEEVFTRVRSLCMSLLDKPKERQLVYRDRMALIYGYSVLFATVSDNPLLMVRSWIAGEQVETDLFQIEMRQSLETHLLRYVPRLCEGILRDTIV